jgi:hypothetical protein
VIAATQANVLQAYNNFNTINQQAKVVSNNTAELTTPLSSSKEASSFLK